MKIKTHTPTFMEKTYQKEIQRLMTGQIPPGARVLHIGCGHGDILSALLPAQGVGVDSQAANVEAAKIRFENRPELAFHALDFEKTDWAQWESFDYIVLADLLPLLSDVEIFLRNLKPLCTPDTRLVLNYHSNLWQPLLSLATFLGLRRKVPDVNWLSSNDIRNLLYLAGFEAVTLGGRMLLPLRIPLFYPLFNRLVLHLPLIRSLCLTWYMVARPQPEPRQTAGGKDATVSIIIPTRNEKGNMEDAFKRTPVMGKWTELIFVDGNSTDGTLEEIERCKKIHGSRFERVEILRQTGKGKGQAVRQGFEAAKGDMLMILDSDLTAPPEELPKFYHALSSGKGEMANGCRLVYPKEDKSMRFLNKVFNHFFAYLFSWLLGQRIKDTLCGTKVLWQKDYDKIVANRAFFGDFDPFGDFDLLFGAARQNRKILDIPVHYGNRTYGEIKINRFRDGMLLFRMSWIAFKRFKL